MSHLKPEFYRSVDDADDYFADQLFAEDWTKANITKKQQALTQATRAIDRLQYRDYKYAVAVYIDSATNPTDEEIRQVDESILHQWPRNTTDDLSLSAEEWLIQVVATGGTYSLTFNGIQTTSDIAYNATAATVQTELEALSAFSSGDLTVVDDTEHGATFKLSMASTGNYATTNHSKFTIDGDSLTGSTTARILTLTDNVPDNIFWAVCEEAMSLLSGRRPQQEWENAVATSDAVSSTRVSSDRNQVPPIHISNLITSINAWTYLAKYLDNSSNYSFRIKRTQ